MYHMDFYRLQGDNDIIDLGLEEYFYLAGLTVIEWSMRATSILPAERLSLEITANDDSTGPLSSQRPTCITIACSSSSNNS